MGGSAGTILVAKVVVMVAATMKGMATATTTTTTDPITTITTTTTTGPITTIGPFTTTGPTGPTGPTLGESSRVYLGAFSTTAGHSTNPERETRHLPPRMESTSDNNKPF